MTDLKLHLLNMSLDARFLRSKKQDHYVKEKICSYVILSKKNNFLLTFNLKIMKKRVRIINRKSLEKAMSLYAKAKSNRISLNNAMEEQLMMVRNNYTDRINEYDEECDTLSTDIIDYARENRDTIFPKGIKHLELTDGTVGYKQGRHSLALQEGHSWASALTALQDDKSAKADLRTKYEIDKARLLADRDKPKVAQIIDRIGLQVVNAEQFYIETKSTD